MPSSLFADGAQIYPVFLDDNTHTLSAAAAQRNINTREKLPDQIRDGVGHSIGLLIELDIDPTFTTAPTPLGLTSAIDRLVVRGENGRIIVDLSGQALRVLLAYQNGGKLVAPDPDGSSGSTNNFYLSLFVPFAPLGMSAKDFAIPNKLLDASVVELTYAAMTDITADATAGTVRSRIYAACISAQRVNVPPKVEHREWPGSGNQLELGDRALIHSMLMADEVTLVTAITAGDFANLTLDDRRGNVLSGVPSSIMGRLFSNIMTQGQFGIIASEPLAGTDDNAKVVGTTVTALASAALNFIPVVFTPAGTGIEQMEVEGPLKLRWSGTQATAQLIGTRILPRSEDESKDMAQRVFRGMKLPFKGGRIRTKNGKPYLGPKAEYLPWEFDFR